MAIEIITILGFIAGAFTTASFLPQVIKSWKTKHTKDLSLWMLIVLVSGIALWLTYGILLKDPPIIIANMVSLSLALLLLTLKIKYD